MRDRLIELLRNAPKTDTVYGNIKLPEPVQTLQTIADHLLSEGVIVPPVKVGQTVFIIDEGDECGEPYVFDAVITAYGYDCSGFWATLRLPSGLKISGHFVERMLGKNFFLTRSEAEKALAERSGE